MNQTNTNQTNTKVATMTNPETVKVTASPARKARRNSPADKIWSAGLATATCIGLVGVIGVRTVEANVDNAAASTATDIALVSAQEPTTSTGLTQADLDAYAVALSDEAAKLAAYRAALVDAGNALQAAGGQQAVQQAQIKQPQIKQPQIKQPVAAPAPAAQPAPQSNTKSS
jgi:hypothetical protein